MYDHFGDLDEHKIGEWHDIDEGYWCGEWDDFGACVDFGEWDDCGELEDCCKWYDCCEWDDCGEWKYETRNFILQTMLRTGKLVSLLSLTKFSFCFHDITKEKHQQTNCPAQPTLK